jgi:pentatricopeptide repeat protein
MLTDAFRRTSIKQLRFFNSIPSYPQAQPIDAVMFEAIINVLVTHWRTDLIPEYISKMNAAGVHMTAYIANFLMRGYVMVGDMEHARSIFESLVDPPEGMAAPGSHVPHEPALWSTADPTTLNIIFEVFLAVNDLPPRADNIYPHCVLQA